MPLDTTDIISDVVLNTAGSLQYSPQGLLTYANVRRVFIVGNLTAKSTPATAQADVTGLLQQVVPVGTPWSYAAQATSLGYDTSPIQNDGDHMQGVVSYIYNSPSITQTEWTQEITPYLEAFPTDQCYGYVGDGVANGSEIQQQIVLDNYYPTWLNQNDPKPYKLIQNADGTFSSINEPADPAKPVYGVTTRLVPRIRYAYTRSIVSKDKADQWATLAETAIGRVNSDTWNGKVPRTVLVTCPGLLVQPYQAQRLARLEMLWKPEGQDPWERYTHPRFNGPPPNLWRPRVASAGVTATVANGMKQPKEYLTVNVTQLMAFFDS